MLWAILAICIDFVQALYTGKYDFSSGEMGCGYNWEPILRKTLSVHEYLLPLQKPLDCPYRNLSEDRNTTQPLKAHWRSAKS